MEEEKDVNYIRCKRDGSRDSIECLAEFVSAFRVIQRSEDLESNSQRWKCLSIPVQLLLDFHN
jgi:hypothetical protein